VVVFMTMGLSDDGGNQDRAESESCCLHDVSFVCLIVIVIVIVIVMRCANECSGVWTECLKSEIRWIDWQGKAGG
jgi:hypothetical protein